jgi:IclR helix-turn-helix domain.
MNGSVRREECLDGEFDTAVEVLSDDYVCRILAALDGGPMPAVELAETCDMSRATAYRRLEQLENLDFVTSTLSYDPDGHHRKQFRLALREFRLEIGDGGVAGTVSLTDRAAD